MVRLTVVPVIPLARSDAMKTATLATSVERHQPSRVGPAGEQLLPLLPGHARCLGAGLEGLPDRARLRHGLWPQTDHANAVRCELGGQVSGERLLGGHRRAVAADQRDARPGVQRGDPHDHPRPVRDHAPGGQARGQEVRRRVGRDRQRELLDVQLDQRHAQDRRVRDPDRVERDVDPARLVDHGLQVPVHGLLVERVDLRRLGGSAGGDDVLGDRLDRRQPAPGEEHLGPLAREGAGDGAADRAAGSVDHRHLVLQHHLLVPFWPVVRLVLSESIGRRPPSRSRETAATPSSAPRPVSVQDGGQAQEAR